MGMASQRQLEQAFTQSGLLGPAEPGSPRTMTCCQAERVAAETGVPLREVECFALDHQIVPLRYALNVGSFRPAGQKKLLQSRVLVVGLGGLGGYVVEQLGRAGVGRIAAADPDVFEEQNMNRQIFCTVAGLGNTKVTATAQRLRQINPAVEFSGYTLRFQQLDDEVFDGLNLVFDCLDGIADRLALEAKCESHNLVLIHGAVAGWFGQVGVVRPGTGLLRKVYGQQHHGVETSLGNAPFTPAVIGGLAVALGIKALLHESAPQEESLRFIDLLENEWEDIPIAIS
jgi:molybdopterin/thiamine biosynthesis adenylyltransferase